jgi:hypothetical protein
MRFILLIIFVLATTAAGLGQDYEYGQPAELRGLRRICVTTAADIKSRDRIVSEIEKAKAGLEIVDNCDAAEIFMRFEAGTEPEVSSNGVIVDTSMIATGSGSVGIRGKAANKLRYLLTFQDRKDKIGEKTPAVKFAKEFIKAYKKANDLR